MRRADIVEQPAVGRPWLVQVRRQSSVKAVLMRGTVRRRRRARCRVPRRVKRRVGRFLEEIRSLRDCRCRVWALPGRGWWRFGQPRPETRSFARTRLVVAGARAGAPTRLNRPSCASAGSPTERRDGYVSRSWRGDSRRKTGVRDTIVAAPNGRASPRPRPVTPRIDASSCCLGLVDRVMMAISRGEGVPTCSTARTVVASG